MRWLHLSDIHLSRSENVSQRTAIQDLFKKVESLLICDVDVVVITGDVAFSGKKDEYELFEMNVLAPLRKIQFCKNAKIFCVPGNHDLDCDISHPLVWDALGASRQKKFFEESADGAKVRNSKATSFNEYSEFIVRNNILSPDPLKEVSKIFDHNSHEGLFHLLGTNSAFFSDKEKDFNEQEMVPLPLMSLRSIVNDVKSGTDEFGRLIILGHHPIEWFKHQHRERFKSFLLDNNGIYIHGHMHKIQAIYGQNGLMTLGFGAAYQGNLENDDGAIFSNMFAICQISGHHLHLAPYNWDGENGRWVETTKLPADFREKSEILPNGWRLTLAKPANSKQLESTSHTSYLIEPPVVQRVITPGVVTDSTWRTIIDRLGLVNFTDTDSEVVKLIETAGLTTRYSYFTKAGQHIVECISGRSHIIAKSEIENANTQIDYDDLKSYTIITFGDIDESARTSYIKLKDKKPLQVITARDLAVSFGVVAGSPQNMYLDQLKSTDTSVDLLLTEEKLYLVVRDKRSQDSFYLVDEAGIIVQSGSHIVRSLRDSESELAKLSYFVPTESSTQLLPVVPARIDDEIGEYLKSCQNEFNSVRYAAMAAIGFRFHNIALSDLYVEADADVDQSKRASESLENSLEDALEGLNLDPSLRVQLEAQLRRSLSIQGQSQTGSVRTLYQKYGSLLILGDPGSGKTCFVNNEIIAYCKNHLDTMSWYRQHVPIFIPLAAAAKETDTTDLIAIGCKLSAKRGLTLSLATAYSLYSAGKLAFFFDGLDEVVSLEVRSNLCKAISLLASTGQSTGNRFVVTSRPAAVKLVDLPETLYSIHLRGLTENQMRTLAKRVLAIRFSETEEGLQMGTDQLQARDLSIIDQLLDDCKHRPGIGRLSKNPLLLTLLIMIYANNGRPAAAKRHRVYAQAIETLTTVRTKQTGQRIFSEIDLRNRLGAAALAVFSNQTGTIPTKDEFAAVLNDVMSKEPGQLLSDHETDRFIQEVAESTGLIIIHTGHTNADPSTVTFMHYSFLEYYAAVGLHGSNNYSDLLPNLSRQPRWKEVISLLIGILGDHADITPVVEKLLKSTSDAEAVTLEMLLFAADCALESDVPPERCQRVLLEAFRRALETGPALVDSQLRDDVGDRILSLYGSSGSNLVIDFILQGISASEPLVAAAYVDILGQISSEFDLPTAIYDVFDQVCGKHKHHDSSFTIAVCNAIARSQALRREPACDILKKGFDGSLAVKYAAVKAVESSADLVAKVLPAVVVALNDEHIFIATSAANALLSMGYSWNVTSDQNTIILRALKQVQRTNQPQSIFDLPLHAEKEKVEELLSSPKAEDRLFALGLLPWLKHEERYVIERCVEVIRLSNDRFEVASALSSLRLAPSVRELLKYGEVDSIINCLTAKTRDVRIAAIRLIGSIGKKDSILPSLLEHAKNCTRNSEYRFTIRAIVETTKDDRTAQNLIYEHLLEYFKRSATKSSDDESNVVELLRACQQYEGLVQPDAILPFLKKIAKEFSETFRVRREAISALASIIPFENSHIEYLLKLVKSPPAKLGGPVANSVMTFLDRARKKVTTIRAVLPYIDDIENALVEQMTKILEQPPSRNVESRLRDLRLAIESTQHLRSSYSEFSQRSLPN